MKKKVLYITNLPAPYKVLYFNELSKYMDLTVVFERTSAKNRDSSWRGSDVAYNFDAIFLKGINFGDEMSFDHSIIKVLRRYSDRLVLINGYSSPTEILAIQYLHKHHVQFGLICDGMLENGESIFAGKIKKFLISRASYWMSSGMETDKVLMEHGAEIDRIYRYPFSSIKESDIAEVPYNRKLYKDMVGCKSRYMVLYVGQMIQRKGIDLLLNAIKEIDLDFRLYMIGGQIPIFDKKVTNIGFLSKEELKNYYMASDLFVLPTREDIWGLVINEALGNGVPVISTDRCGAALELIKNGKNGFIIPADNVAALKMAIAHVLQAPCTSSYMLEAVSTARSFTIEKMAERTCEIICKQQGY